MCDRSPSARCSDYATSTLKITKKRLEKIQAEKAAYEEKYAESLANTENPTPRDVIRQNKYKRLIESEKAHQRIVDGAEFEYYSCPVGQAELAEDLKKAIEAGDAPLQEELEARIQAGKDYRADARETARRLDETEKEEGPEAAQEQNWRFYEEAVETETEATIQMEKSQVELDAARAEREEYERAMEEYRKNNRIDTPEEERAKALKKKLILVTIGTLAAAVLTYSLLAQAAGGKKSQLLQTGKSMMMRQAMTGGRQVLTRMIGSSGKEEDARERRAESEAEQRAKTARERIYQKHEKGMQEEERKKLRDEERQAELLHRNAMRSEERMAERERRREELEHYEELVKTFKDVNLTPEMQEYINSKKPQGYRPSSNQGNPNGRGRARSTRKQGNPDVAGKAARDANPNVAGEATGNTSKGANTAKPQPASTATAAATAATAAMPKVEVSPVPKE
jgi:hypothetical protein